MHVDDMLKKKHKKTMHICLKRHTNPAQEDIHKYL